MLSIAGIELRYGDVTALAGVDLEVADREVLALLGPSGSGKSSLLRAVAGLEAPDAGTVAWDGRDLAGVAAHRRGFGLMFQDLALFPHRTVAGNVAFGLRMQGMAPRGIDARVGEVLGMVGLAGYGERAVSQLSGGEQQRVALARALAPNPRLLMLDEPLGSLDRALREHLMVELRELFVALGITALYVTHDQEEAFAVADRVAVLRAGKIEQVGAPEELWQRPATEFVASFIGFTNIVDATLRRGRAETPWGSLPYPTDLEPGPYRLVVRPDAFTIALGGPIAAVVESSTFRGDHVLLRLRPDAGPPIEAVAERRHPTGERIYLTVAPEGMIVLG